MRRARERERERGGGEKRERERERGDRYMYMQLYMYMYIIEGEVIISYPRETQERGWIGNQYMWPHLGKLPYLF